MHMIAMKRNYSSDQLKLVLKEFIRFCLKTIYFLPQIEAMMEPGDDIHTILRLTNALWTESHQLKKNCIFKLDDSSLPTVQLVK